MNHFLIQWGIITSCILITGCNSSDIDSTTSSLSDNATQSVINSSTNNDLSSANVSANNGNSSSMPTASSSANPIVSSSSNQNNSSSSSISATRSSTGPIITSSSNQNSSISSSNSSSVNPSSSDGSLAIDSFYPASKAVNRALVTSITVEFDGNILANSFDDNLITLQNKGNRVAGSLIQNADNRFTFTPSKTLAPFTVYTVNVSEEVMSQEGLTGNAFSWEFTTTGDLGETSQTVIDSCMNERDISMLDSVNKARSQSRICGNESKPATTKIRWNCLVEKAAQIHSDDMASKNFFDHTGSDGSSAGDRITRVGYNWRGWSENIAAGQPDVNSVMLGWLESPDHCKNIMNTGHKEFGLGYTVNNNTQYRLYWTQNFATAR